MRITTITAGAGRMECDICLRDGVLAAAYKARGHEVLFVPTYTPLAHQNGAVPASPLFLGGINIFLQQKFSLFRHTPAFIDRFFDSRWLINFVSRFGRLTQAADLAELTISVLEAEEGRQRKEFDQLVSWLAAQPRPDLVVLPNSLLAGLAGPLRRALGVPVLCLLSGEDAFIEEFPEPWRARTLEVLRRRAGQIDGFLATSRYYAGFMKDYLNVPAEKIHLMTAGIDCRPFAGRERRPPEVFTIGFRSALNPSQGLHLLIEAFDRLKRRPETAACRLRMAGHLGPADRPYFQKNMNQLQDWGYLNDVEYVGELDPAQRVEFLAGISVLAVPAVYPEPMGLYVPEALAAGVPVVAPRAGCLPEWLKASQGGLLIEPDDVDSLTAALDRLMRDRPLANRLAAQGRDYILQNHDINKMTDSILNVFTAFMTKTPA